MQPHILYIEDDAAMRKMFSMLQKSILKDYQISYAETLTAGLNELKQNPKKFSAVISDYFLPDGEAKDLFPMPFDLPVMVLTATYDVTLAVTLMKLGVDDFLVKDKEMQFIKLIPEKIKSIIEKKTAEREAAQEKRRFSDLFENANDIIQYLGEDGKIMHANPQLFEILGYEKNDLEQILVFDLVHPDDRDRYKLMISNLKPGEKFDDVEMRVVGKSGKPFIMEASASKGWLSDDLSYTRTIFHDVTEKKMDDIKIRQQNIDLADKNKQVNDGLVKLRRATASRKSTAIVFGIGIALFVMSEYWLEPMFIKYSGNTNYLWIFKTVIVVLLKPIDMFLERWMLRQKIREAGLA
jgi:PAS domain S-box-containing protein